MNRHWIEPDTPLPSPRQDVPGHPGLIALGRDLSPARLLEAYCQGIFPWYSEGQPVLWWSPDPRMVVFVDEFRPSRTLRRLLRQLRHGQHTAPEPVQVQARPDPRVAQDPLMAPKGTASPQQPPAWRVSLDGDFEAVMRACAAPRDADGGTWITEDIITAYVGLHRAGFAHSIEVHEGADLIAGLYGVAIGRMFFGESMFTRRSNASKCAFAVLMQLLRQQGFELVDCQQSTRHLGSLGGREISRDAFLAQVDRLIRLPGPDWSSLRVEWPAGDWLSRENPAGESPTGDRLAGESPTAWPRPDTSAEPSRPSSALRSGHE